MNSIPQFCPACNETEITPFYGIEDLPLLLFPVDEKVRHSIKSESLQSYLCSNCSHIFTNPLSNENAALIYGDYYRYYPYDNLESMGFHYRKPFENFFERVIKSYFGNKREGLQLLEIGCSSGKQLEFFEQFNISCFGIDPSPLNNTADSRLISGFYQDHRFEKPYDIIVARFVLEHVNFLEEFLGKVYRDLNDNGIVFIQVPNIQEFIINFIPSFLAHEHTQYFNSYSLMSAANKSRLKVQNIMADGSQSIIISLVKVQVESPLQIVKPEAQMFSQFLSARKTTGIVINKLLDEFGDKICYYGSGLTIAWLLYDLKSGKSHKTGVIIDDNPILHDRFMPCSDYKVSNLIPEVVSGFETMLLTLNPVYHKAVLDKLRKINFKGRVFSLTADSVVEIV